MRGSRSLPIFVVSVLLAVSSLAATGCTSSAARARGSAEVLRLGVLPMLSSAPAYVGIDSGIFEADLAPTRVELHVFDSGYEAGVALFSGSIDATYMEPWPAASVYLKSGHIAVVSGASVGGASLVVRRGAGVHARQDLRGKRIAVPNVGNSQDIALRTWLHRNGMQATDEGGDVSITELDCPELLQLFQTGRLDGAWVPEPYVSWLLDEGVADELVDEASLWAPGRFLTANLVVSKPYMRAHPDVVDNLVRANVHAIRFLAEHPTRSQRIAERQLHKSAGVPPMSAEVIDAAWRKLTFTWDPVPESMIRVAENAHALGVLFARPERVRGVYRLDALDAVLKDEGLPPLELRWTMEST
ncbi:MAG: ABC transporter substrate-binding protein [Actinomycetota bacterium]